jgi:hypothetical protein
MTNEELAAIQRWQHTDGGKAELAIHGLSIIVDDLTDAIKTREGTSTIRANFKMLMDAKRKLDDLMFELGPFAAAAE